MSGGLGAMLFDLYDDASFWLLNCMFVVFFIGLMIHRSVDSRRPPRKNILWLLPDDHQMESYVDDVTLFVSHLKQFDVVTFNAMSYRVTRTELIIGEEWNIAVVLE
jgi:hypothetical protein